MTICRHLTQAADTVNLLADRAYKASNDLPDDLYERVEEHLTELRHIVRRLNFIGYSLKNIERTHAKRERRPPAPEHPGKTEGTAHDHPDRSLPGDALDSPVALPSGVLSRVRGCGDTDGAMPIRTEIDNRADGLRQVPLRGDTPG